MKILESTRQMERSVIIALIVLAVFFLILNILFPTQSDDLGAKSGGLAGALNAYYNWNGRLGEMLRVGFVASIVPTWYFAFINAAFGFVFVMAFFVFIFARLPRKFDDVVILCLFMIIFMHFGAFGSVFLWAAGSLNYLWAYVFLLFCFIPYRLFWERQIRLDSQKFAKNGIFIETIKAFAFMGANFFAGMGSEMVGIVAIIVHIGVLGYWLMGCKGVKLPLWYYAGVLGLAAGWITLYLSPGHAKRAALFHELLGKDSFYSLRDLWEKGLAWNIHHLGEVYTRFMGEAKLIFLSILIFLCFERYRAGGNRFVIALMFVIGIGILAITKYWQNLAILPSANALWLLYFVALGSLMVWAIYFYKRQNSPFSMLFIRVFIAYMLFCLLVGTTIQVGIPGRARFAYVMIECVILFYVLSGFYILLGDMWSKRLKQAVLAVCMCCGIFVLSAYIDGRIKWEAMLTSIEAQKAEGKEEIIVDAKTFKSFYKKYGDWGNPGENPNVWPNTTYAHYYGVKSFIAK